MSNAPPASSAGINLYISSTSGSQVAAIALEELRYASVDLEWKLHKINLATEEHRQPWFIELSPAGKVPVLVDHDKGGANIWESGAILLYLAEHYDTSHKLSFASVAEKAEMTAWILYASTSLSVQQDALRLALSQLAEASATARGAITELRDIYGVHEARLAAGGGRDFLVGEGKGEFSFADIAAIPWIYAPVVESGKPNLGDAGFPLLSAWRERCLARVGTRRGIDSVGQVDLRRTEERWLSRKDFGGRATGGAEEEQEAGAGERQRDEL